MRSVNRDQQLSGIACTNMKRRYPMLVLLIFTMEENRLMMTMIITSQWPDIIFGVL